MVYRPHQGHHHFRPTKSKMGPNHPKVVTFCCAYHPSNAFISKTAALISIKFGMQITYNLLFDAKFKLWP